MDKHVLLGTTDPLKNTSDSPMHKHVLDPGLGCQSNRSLLRSTSTCDRLILQSPNTLSSRPHTPDHTGTRHTADYIALYFRLAPIAEWYIWIIYCKLLHTAQRRNLAY